MEPVNNQQQCSPMNEQPPKKKMVPRSLLQMGMIKNVFRSLITTTLGIIIILGSVFSSVAMETEWSDSMWGMLIGACLVIAPDKLITKLTSFIKK